MVILVMYYVFQEFPAICYQSIKSLIWVKVKSVTFTPHQVVIKDFKDPQNVLATRIVDDITRLYKFNNFGPSPFRSVSVAHSDNLSKLRHE